MDKTTKTILIVIVSLLVLCICASVAVLTTGLISYKSISKNVDTGLLNAEQDFVETPLKAVRVGAEITDYIVPAGFTDAYSVHFGDVTVVGYKSQNKRTHIILAQFPEGTSINFEEALKMIGQAADDPDNIWFNTKMSVLEEIPVTIHDQETTLIISEGETSEGVLYRMATANFQGRGGPAFMMIAGPANEWDLEMVKEFISSTH